MLEHAIKILEKVFERRIQGAITIRDIQIGFMPGKRPLLLDCSVELNDRNRDASF